MTVMPQAKLDVVPLTKHIGAEIRGLDLREKPDDATIQAIYQAWLDHIVIIFPDQKLSQEDLIRASKAFDLAQQAAKHMLVRGEVNRDSAWYSVLDEEWPSVRAHLERRLATR